MTKLTIRKPDDWHLHLRDGEMLKSVLPHTSATFARAIIMPNLVPPVVTTADAVAYRERILAALPKEHSFTPLMTLYLTEGTDPDDVEAGFRDGTVTAAKLYPAGATTNSQSGVRSIDKVMPVLERMAEIGMTMCVHGEVTSADVDIFDREAVFLETVLAPLRERLPELRVVLEHVTTSDGVDFVMGAEKNLGATITPHHLMINRNAILAGGIRLDPDRHWMEIDIRPEARFHDSSPVTAEDVVFSFRLLRDQGQPFYRAYYAGVDQVEALDDDTVRFEFSDNDGCEGCAAGKYQNKTRHTSCEQVVALWRPRVAL